MSIYTELVDAAKPWYEFNEENRLYHNWNHALYVGNVLYNMTDEPSDQLVLAAIWHDAVYVPGAEGDANEQCSSRALWNTSRKLSPITQRYDAAIKLSCEMIEYTSVEYHLHDRGISGDLGYLLDADLSAFAVDFPDFVTTQNRIILEQGGDPIVDRHKSALFLQLFLDCREFIYHTDYGRDTWEKLARENITRFVETYGISK